MDGDTKHTTILDKFPLEIHLAVGKFISSPRDLLNMCRTSRRMQDFYELVLYRSYPYLRSYHSYSSLAQFVSRVLRRKDLAEHVRVLDFVGRREDLQWLQRRYQTSLSNLAPLPQNILFEEREHIYRQRMLHRRRERNTSYFPSLHDLNLDTPYANRFMLLRQGMDDSDKKREFKAFEEDMNALQTGFREMGLSQEDIDFYMRPIRSFDVRPYYKNGIHDGLWLRQNYQTTVERLLGLLVCRLPYLTELHLVRPSAVGLYDVSSVWSIGTDHVIFKPQRSLKVLKIKFSQSISCSNYTKEDNKSNASDLGRSLVLPNLQSIYTFGLIQYRFEEDDDEIQSIETGWNRALQEVGERSSDVTDIAFDNGWITTKLVEAILRTLKTLRRFRWNHDLSEERLKVDRWGMESNEDRNSGRVQSEIIGVLSKYAGTLEELDLRFDPRACEVEPSTFIGDLVGFTNLKSLTIDPKSLYEHPYKLEIEPKSFEHLLPTSLSYLGLIYPDGLWGFECRCLQPLQKLVWGEHVPRLASSWRTLLPKLKHVDIICAKKEYFHRELEPACEMFLKMVKKSFIHGGLSCSISYMSDYLELPSFNMAEL